MWYFPIAFVWILSGFSVRFINSHGLSKELTDFEEGGFYISFPGDVLIGATNLHFFPRPPESLMNLKKSYTIANTNVG